MSPWESKGPTPAKDLVEGDRVDFDPTAPYITDANRPQAEAEYGFIQSVGGGWAAGLATEGEVVLYTENFAEPLILPADTLVHVERWH
jgi:hypothetical protein